jgi:hypothetical protein
MPRFSLEADVEFEWGSAILRARVTDISRRGMFLRIRDPLWVGASFRARLLLDDPLTVDVVVRRVLPMEGMGVDFLEMSPETQQQLELLLGKLGG